MTRSLATSSAVVLLILPALLAPLPASGQDLPGRRTTRIELNYNSYFGPATAASLQIQADAQYLRAVGQMQVDFAEARILHAEARKLEGENRAQELLAKIKFREVLDAKRGQRIRENIAMRRQNNEKTWERLKNHPELTSGEILTGRALNFLKDRLSTNVITYQGDKKNANSASQDVAKQLQVTPEMIHGLQVREVLGRGERLIFRLDEGRPIQVDWWPPGLRDPGLKGECTAFEKARNDVFAAQTQETFDANINKLLLAHEKLEHEFLFLKPHAERVKTQQSIHIYLDGKAFLRSLVSEIRRLERVGRGQNAARDLAFRGSDVTELLTHMVRNGLEFGPAKPGDEPAYQQVFHMLRDLYVATETDALESAAAK